MYVGKYTIHWAFGYVKRLWCVFSLPNCLFLQKLELQVTCQEFCAACSTNEPLQLGTLVKIFDKDFGVNKGAMSTEVSPPWGFDQHIFVFVQKAIPVLVWFFQHFVFVWRRWPIDVSLNCFFPNFLGANVCLTVVFHDFRIGSNHSP